MAGINKIKRKPIMIELDKERELKFTLYAMGELEEKYGSIDEALTAMRTAKMRDVMFFLHTALMHEDENLTVKQVGNMVDVNDLQYVVRKLIEAMNGDLPEGEGEANPN